MEEATFLLLIQKHSGIIRKILYLYADNPDDRADLHQEILFQAWKSIDRFQGKSAFSTWLYRLALNTVLTHKRKEKRIQKEKIMDQTLIMQSENETSERSDILWMAIKQLNDIDKSIITLHLEDYANDEIASILGISKNHVAVKLHRIRQQLEKKLRND